jgi:hypothetical protein
MESFAKDQKESSVDTENQYSGFRRIKEAVMDINHKDEVSLLRFDKRLNNGKHT